MNKNKIIGLCFSVFLILVILWLVFFKSNDKELQKDTVKQITNAVVNNYQTHNMSNEDIEKLPTTEVTTQNEQEEKNTGEEQTATEKEGFKEQGEIEYNGSNKAPSVSLGSYKGLTYYSQIDSRWRYHSYTITGNNSQNIGTSGCRTDLGCHDCYCNQRKYNSSRNGGFICAKWLPICKQWNIF